MERIKKIVSLLLALCLIMGLSTTAFASENTLTTIENNENVVVVKEVTSNGITIATNDKNTNLLTVENYDSTGEFLISSQVINLNTIADELGTVEKPTTRAHWGNGDVYQHTFSDYEYDIWYGNPNEWKVRKPQNSTTYYINETSSNSSKLYAYADRVEDVNEAEFVIVGAVGGTAAATAIAAFLTGGAAAGAAAAGGGAAIVAAFANLNSCCNKALLVFNSL